MASVAIPARRHPSPVTTAGECAPATRTLDDAIAAARTTGRRVAVCVVGLQGLAALSAGCGPATADAARASVDAAVRGAMRRADAAVAIGRGAVLVVARDLGHPADAERVADRLRAALSPVPGEARAPGVRVHVGLAIFPNHGDDARALLAAAEASLGRARHAGEDEPFRWGAVVQAEVA